MKWSIIRALIAGCLRLNKTQNIMNCPFTTRKKIKTPLLFFALICAFVFASINSKAQCDVSTGLIEHWKLDGNLTNSVSSHTATSNSPAYTTDRLGNANGAISLGAWNSTLATPVTINQTNYSYCVWLKRSGNNANSWAAVGAGNSNGMPLIVANNTNYGLNNGGGTFTYGVAPNTINTWHHLVYTKSGTTAKLYYDGILVATTTLISSFGLTNLAGVGTSNETVTGAYDEYRVYNRELSPADITTIYNSTPAYTFAPLITVDPLPAFTCGTQTVTLAALANGVGNTYQWQKDEVNVSGANNDTLILPNASIADIGSYRLIATNSCGADTSAAAQLMPSGGTISNSTLHLPFITQYGQLNFKDYSGNNLNPNFTYMGSDVDAQGTTGSAIILNGTQNGQVPHNNLLNITNQVTLSCWFNANNITTTQRLLDKTPANNGNNFLLDLLGSKPRFIIAGGSHTISSALTSATWYHVAATYNGAQVKIYINGMLAYTGNQTGNCASNTLPLMIGADQNSATRFTGRLDEIRMYSTALTDVEIYGLYAGPKLTIYPESVVTCSGNSATLSVQGSGTGYTYQWQKNGVDLNGATAATYTDNSVTAADTGSYVCVLTRNCYSVNSTVAKLNLPTAFNASTGLSQYWPFNNSDNSNAAGGVYFNIATAGFSPDRQGTANNALDISSQFTAVSLNNSICCAPKTFSLWYKYSGASNGGRVLLYSATSNTDLLLIYGTGQVAVNGNQTTNYTLTNGQWYHFVLSFNGTNGTLYINGAVVATVTGITNNVVSKIGNNNNGQSAAVGVLDEIRVYDYEFTLSNVYSLYTMSAVTTQPLSQTVCASQSVSFTAAASGPVTYQWKKGNTIIPSATSATYTIASPVAGDAGSYTCDMTDACSGATLSTSAAVLTVTGNVAITQQPSVTNAAPVCGTGITFSVTAADATSYQWRKDGNDIQGANFYSYAISNTNAGNSGFYDCVIGGCSGSINSNAVLVNVVAAISPAGIINQWKLNNNFTDNVGGNNLTASGAYAFGFDRFNNATNGVAANAAASAFLLTAPITRDTITISLWYKHTVSTGYKTIIGDTAGRYSDILAVVNNEIKWSKGGSGSFATGIQLSLGWHHIAITKQGNAMQFFVDGNLAYTPTNAASVPAMGVSTQINRFGNTAPQYNNQVINGSLDDIRIYNSVLNATQVANIYTEAEIYTTGNFSAACIGGSSSVTVSAASRPTTQYQWQKNGLNINGATTSTLTINNIQAGDAGSYTCLVSSSAGCVFTTSDTVTLTPGAGNVSVSSQPQAQVKCVGQAATFSVATTGATVTYQWKKNGNVISGQTSTTLNIGSVTANDAATYTCDIIGGSCGTISTTGAVLTVNTPAVITVSPASPAICAGASATLTVNGGSTYSWSNNGGSSASATFSPVTTTTYNVTAVDANGCSATASKAITVNSLPTAAITGNAGVCPGGSTTLTANGGTSYAWSNTLGNTAAVTVSPSGNTTYTVTATNANNCSATASQLVTVNANPVANISPAGTTICAGTPATLLASGGNSYNWSNSLGANASQSVTPAITTTYIVTVTNSNNCSATSSATVTVNALPSAAITGNSSICQGESVTLTAGGGTYSWSNNGGTNAIATFSPTTSTTYTVTVTGAGNCTAIATKTVTVNSVTATINGPTTICSGLSATLTAGGGNTYVWNNSLGNSAAITVSPSTATTYTVTVTGVGNCTATASQTVSVQNTPTATVSGPTSVCAGSSVSLTANGGNTYSWSNGLGSSSTVSVSPTTATTYTVTASLGANCSASTTYTVTVLQPSASSFSQTICNGETFGFDGNSLSASGAYTQTLVNSVGCDSVITLNLIVLSPITTSLSQTICAGGNYDFNGTLLTQAGTYYDTLASTQNCDSVVTLQLALDAGTSISSEPTASTAACAGNAVDLSVAATGSALAYQWFKDGVALSGANNSAYTIAAALATDSGAYTVQVTGTCGADTSDAALVLVNATPAPVVTATGAALSSSITGNSYQWYFNGAIITGATAQNYIATQTGDYHVEVTSADGCTGTSADLNVVISGIENLTALKLSVYPNPATELLIIYCDETVESIEVYNIVGQQVIFAKGQITSLNVSTLAQGTYMLHAKTKSGDARKPFVKN
jgi:hypothetical protein